ncbi:translocation/assembly module TamB domain-containing protein [Acetobacter pasteurianus]
MADTPEPILPRTPDKPARPLWRRMGRIALITGGSLVGITGLAVAVLLVGANTGPGRKMLMHQTSSLTGGMIGLSGMSGRFPDNFRLDTLEIRDKQGAWLTLHNVALNWSPLAIIGRTARIYAVTADELDIPRLPVSDPAKPATPSKSSPSALHLGVDIRKLAVGRINVGAALAGSPASFALAGHGKISNIDPVINGLSLPSLPGADIALHLKRLDAAGQIDLATTTSKGKLGLHLDASEGTDGFAATRLKMPQLVPLALKLDIKGPPSAAVLGFAASAGDIKAHADGVLDLLAEKLGNLNAGVDAPAMSLSPDLAWGGIHLGAQLHGKMAAPLGTAQVQVDQLAASGAGVGTLKVQFSGENGSADMANLLHVVATADGVRLPGKAPTLLASAPLQLDAQLEPQKPGKPLAFTLSHPLLNLSGNVQSAAPQRGTVALKLPDLLPLGEMAGTPLRGSAGMNAQFDLPAKPEGDTHLTADGTLAITGGQPQATGLIGPDGKFALTATMRPLAAQDKLPAAKQIDLQSLTVDGRALNLKGGGQVNTGRDMDLAFDLGLTDLARALPSLRGALTLALQAKGPMQDFTATLHAKGDPGTATMPRGPIELDANVQHLPTAPEGTVQAHGTLNRAPLLLDVALAQSAQGDRQVDIRKLSWNSVAGQGQLSLPTGEVVPLGTLDLKVGRLADFRPLIGQAISGALAASVKTTQVADKPQVALKLDGNVAMPSVKIGSLALAGTVKDPAAHPNADLTLKLGGLSASGVTGQARLSAKGPDNAMALTAQVGPASWSGSPLMLDTAALLNLPAKQVKVQRLNATAKQETLRLLAPALVSFGDTMGVDRLRATLVTAGSQPATIDVAGKIKPSLAVTADIRNLTPALAHPFAPDFKASGTVSVQAKVAGTLNAPQGQVKLTGRDLRMAGSSAAASIPPLHLDAAANLAGSSAKVQVAAGAGPKLSMNVAGTAPLNKTGPMNLRVNGNLDLSIANGILGAQARQAMGQAQMALLVAGTMSSPRVTGTVDLRDADVQDFAQGFHLANINGRVVGENDKIVIQNLTAKAGDGSLGVTGFVGIGSSGMPLDIHLQAHDARPISSDLLTAVMNADIAVKGQVQTRMDVDGTVDLRRVEINIPNSLPSSVARLDVVRPGDEQKQAEAAKAESTKSAVIGLNLNVTSPGKFFVRGHGLDAEMAGRLKVGGTTQAPLMSGGFDLKRGNFDLAGISLNFTKGRVAFNGSGVGHKMDPTLDFEADRAVQGQTAMLKVGGYASAPKITFESMPPLPQDQVLAMLLFGTDAHSLSSTQMVELGTALATLTGLTPFDPMGTIRKTLHLDRLAIGGGSGVGNGGTSVEAGKYVMKGVYVGAKQATSGSGTQAQVQVDLTKHLKLNTTVGTGGTVTGFTTPENDPGSSVGLLWQYRY